MKKLFLFFSALLAAIAVNAAVVTFNFTDAESLAAMGVTELPASGTGYNLTGKSLRVGDIEITTIDGSAATPTRIWPKASDTYELRTYSNSSLILTAASGVTILSVEIESSQALHITGWTSNKQFYDSISSVTLACTGKNYIQKIIVVTDGGTDSGYSNRPITVTSALEIGSLLNSGETTPLTYEIIGYVSNLETLDEDYVRWGDQSFWITDSLGSTANTNAQGALHVYQGVSPTAVKFGDKVSVVSAIKKFSSTNAIETVTKAPVTILEVCTIIPPVDTIVPPIDTIIPPVDTIRTPDRVPTDAVLADYYNYGDVCVCIYVPAEINCNNIILTGSFNGWSSTLRNCKYFEQVEGYDGWYVASYTPEANPDANDGLQAKPIMLDGNGNFNWDYQVGAATVIRGGVQVRTGGYAGEIDLINYGTNAPNVYTVDAWKHNPCTTVYHNYTITVINDGCNGYAIPYISGSMTNWTFQQMNYDMSKSTAYGADCYTYSFRGYEGESYQLLSSLMDEMGRVEEPAWVDISYMQKKVDGVWMRIPGEEGDNQLTHENANIVWDLRNDDLRWTRCGEVLEHVVLAVRFPSANKPQGDIEIIGDFDGWTGTLMNYLPAVNYYYVDLNVTASQYFKFRPAGSWSQEIEIYNAENDAWAIIEDGQFRFGQLWNDDSYQGVPVKMIELDWSDANYFRWSGSATPVEDHTYTFVLFDPACDAHPEFAPQMSHNGNFIAFQRGMYQNREAWILSLEAEPSDGYTISDVNIGYGNQLQYFDAATGLWWTFPTKTFPQIADTIVLDYSDTERYRYPLCGTLVHDDETYMNITVTLKAPAGAPEKVAIVGDFISGLENSWEKGTLMKYKNGVYTATVKATANSQFKFREYKGYSNYIEYTNGGALENLVFGEYMDETQTNVYVDLSDNSRYKWIEWTDYIPLEIYTVVGQADDSQNGSVSGSGEYKENETAVLMATPRKDCTFERWSDGSILNPRSVTITSDTVFTAVFHRNVPLPPVISSDTMYFTSADTLMLAKRVYAASEIQAYDKLIIATVDNKNIMGYQAQGERDLLNYRTTVEYVQNMNISNVSVVEVVPNDGYYRLRVVDGELAPRCQDCYHTPNQLYATEIGADWYFAQYGYSVVPEAVAYANRMILYNEEAPRFSSYRQVTGLDRLQTTVYKLGAPRIVPQVPEEVVEDLNALITDEEPLEEIPVDVEPQDTVAVVSTPYVDFVFTFTLIIWADEAHTQVLMIITYDSEGNQLSVTRPNAVRRLASRNNDVRFEIGDLSPETTYYYTIMACEDDGSVLKTVNSSFATTGTEGIQDVLSEQKGISKFLHNGQIFILRDGKIFTITGVEVK